MSIIEIILIRIRIPKIRRKVIAWGNLLKYPYLPTPFKFILWETPLFLSVGGLFFVLLPFKTTPLGLWGVLSNLPALLTCAYTVS